MREIIRSTSQLGDLRAAMRRDVAAVGDDETIVDDFVSAVNEVVAAAVSSARTVSPSIDVRWRRQTQPQTELFAEVRSTEVTPTSLIEDGITARLLRHYAERVDFDERIGGSVITVRCRV